MTLLQKLVRVVKVKGLGRNSNDLLTPYRVNGCSTRSTMGCLDLTWVPVLCR